MRFAGGTSIEADAIPEGTVIETNPPIGSKVSADTTITVKVSKGSESVTVPNLVGMTKDAAAAKLAGLGLNGSATSNYSDTVPEGQVISQNPYYGTKVEAGSTVTYVVSKGMQNVTVPSINGSTEADAKAALKAAGLSGAALGYVNDSQPAGTVIKQNPAAGQEIAPGSSVNYYLSLGPKEPDQGGDDSGDGGSTDTDTDTNKTDE